MLPVGNHSSRIEIVSLVAFGKLNTPASTTGAPASDKIHHHTEFRRKKKYLSTEGYSVGRYIYCSLGSVWLRNYTHVYENLLKKVGKLRRGGSLPVSQPCHTGDRGGTCGACSFATPPQCVSMSRISIDLKGFSRFLCLLRLRFFGFPLTDPIPWLLPRAVDSTDLNECY